MDRSKYRMPLIEAVTFMLDARKMSFVNACRMVTLLARDCYAMGYKAAQADINARNAAKQSKNSNPFDMREVAPGIFAMTLDNPEQLFQLLDDIEHHQRTGEIPFDSKRANNIAKAKGEGPYFV